MKGWKWLKQTGLFGLAVVFFVVVMTFSFIYWEDQTGRPGLPKAGSPSIQPPLFVGGKYEPPAVLTTVGHLYPDIEFKNGEDLQNNILNRLFEDKLGIKVNYLWTTTGDEDVYINKLNTSIATGQPLPDIVSFKGGQNLYPLLRSGASATSDRCSSSTHRPSGRRPWRRRPRRGTVIRSTAKRWRCRSSTAR